MTRTEWYVLSEEDQDTLERAKAVAGWMADATGRYPNIGDSERSVNGAADAVLPPVAGCEDATAYSLPQECFGANFLDETGYAVVRTVPNVPENAKTSIFLTCARHGRTHKHEDDLSFEFVSNGKPLLVDSGRYSYDYDEMRAYMRSRAAHNTVRPLEWTARPDHTGACLLSADWFDGVWSAWGVASLGKGALHERKVSYSPGKMLSVVDGVAGSGPFELRWHLGPTISATIAGDDTATFVLSPESGDPTEARLDPRCTWRVHRGVDKSAR